MIELKQIAGILNTDDADDVIGLNHHKMARNVKFRGAVSNLRGEAVYGTTLIPNSLLPDTGTNQCVGVFFDSVKQRILFAEWNSGGKNGWYQYDISTTTFSKLLVSFTDSQTDILNFSRDYPIVSINIIYATDDIGDTLTWVDRLNRPMKLNIPDALAGLYGAFWIQDYLTVARPMPLIAPVCSYNNDSTVDLNNLRKKLYQFRYRYIYKDFTTSTWSPISKLFAPQNIDNIADDIDPQKNNRIDAVVQTGGNDVVKIEIAARQSISTTFSDWFSIITLDKSTLSIASNSIYTYKFYNDSSYAYIDTKEADLLFDNVPIKCNCQELLNGNTIVYGGTTEGYTFSETLNVTSSISLVDNTSNIALTVNVTNGTYTQNSGGNLFDTGGLIYTLSGGLTNVVSVTLSFNAYPQTGGTLTNSVVYTLNPGDTLQDVVDGLFAQFPVTDFDAIKTSTTETTVPPLSLMVFEAHGGTTGYVEIMGSFTVAYSGTIPINDINISCFKNGARYSFGLVYFDEFGVTNGVVYQPATMNLEIPELDTTGGTAPKIAQITFSINHQPPTWATNFSWVRTTNLSFVKSFATVTFTTKKDSLYGYLDITNLQTNNQGYPVYDYASGDRVRIVGKFVPSSAGTVSILDFPISAVVENPAGIGTGTFIKIPYTAAASFLGTAGYDNVYIEVYTPAANIDEKQLFFYEFGENYPVINPGLSARSHGGQQQDQIFGTQPAIFNFVRGDFYERKRNYFVSAGSPQTCWILDQSVSDLYPSKVQSIGRAFIVQEFARQQYFPTLIRWGLSYQQDTDINQTNRFYPLNFDEIDRQFGDIERFKTRDRIMRIFQRRRCGQVGVYTKFIQDSGGTNTLTTTDSIISSNNVQYYRGDFGVGDQYTSLVSGKFQDYFVDPIRGYQIRLSDGGNIAISELYKGQFYIKSLLVPYANPFFRPDGSRAKIIGVYDYLEEQYHCILQGGRTANDPLIFGINEVDIGVFYLSFSGTPVAGDAISVYLENDNGNIRTITYTAVAGDTATTIRDAIRILINAGSFFTAAATTISGNPGLNITTTISMGVMIDTSLATLTYPLQIDNYNFSFNEPRNAYASFYDWQPEFTICANDMIYSWLNGNMYIHNNTTTYCKFYGTQYYPSITFVWNKDAAVRKTFNTISYQSNKFWQSPTNGDVYTSEINQFTGFQQESQLKTVDFSERGNYKDGAFLRDKNSMADAAIAVLEGDYLSGTYVVTKLSYLGSDFVYIFSPYINYELNNRNF